MVQRAITRFVDVVISKGTPSVSVAGFGIPLVIIDTPLISTSVRVKSFSTVEDVESYFGAGSESALLADAYFTQDPENTEHPETLLFGRFALDDTSGTLECGTSPELDFEVWKLIDDGEFSVDVNGVNDDVDSLDFTSVTSLDDVATVITAGLTSGTCTFLENRFVIISPTDGATSTMTLLSTVATPAGTDISGSGFLDGDILKSISNPGGSILSQGQVAESFEDGLTAIENVDNTWATMFASKNFRSDSVLTDMVDSIESRRKIFLITSNDPNILVSGNETNICFYIKDLNFGRSGVLYDDDPALYPAVSWAGQQLPKPLGSSNWAYKTLAGIDQGADQDIPGVVLTEAQKNTALAFNCNLYTETQGATYTYFGTMGGGRNADKEGEFIDVVRNIDFLQARVEEGLLSLLLEKDIIPFTDAGITIVENRLQSLLKTYGVDQGILVDGSVITNFPKRADVSQIDRDDRLLPDGTFQAELQGGINRVIVRGIVSI